MSWQTSHGGLPRSIQRLLRDIAERDIAQLRGPNPSVYVDIADWEYRMLEMPRYIRGRRVKVWYVRTWQYIRELNDERPMTFEYFVP